MTDVSTLTRTHEQRMAALANANRVRIYRSELKRNLAAGADIVPILADPSPEVLTMRVVDLLGAQRKWGRFRVTCFMKAHRVSLAKTVGGLSDRQRAELVKALEERS